MLKSRTVHTCENILKSLIREYGPVARVGYPLIRNTIIEVAGGDPRTVKRYWDTLLNLKFVLDCHEGGTYAFNFKKVDFAQLNLHESLIEVTEEPP